MPGKRVNVIAMAATTKSWLTDITLLGAAIAALGAIITTVRKLTKNIATWISKEVTAIIKAEIKPLYDINQRYSDVQDTVLTALTEIHTYTKELAPNHGSRLRDTIETMAEQIKTMQKENSEHKK